MDIEAIELRVLIVEDQERDCLLVLRELKQNGYVVTHRRVETATALVDALESNAWDIIISDYTMPRFSAPEALTILQDRGLDIPFIITSGTIGEDAAVEAMRAGAADYFVKGHLARLGPAIERELREARQRSERRRVEEALKDREADFRLLFMGNPHPMWVYDAQTLEFLEVNDTAVRTYGYSRAEFMQMRMKDVGADEAAQFGMQHPDHLDDSSPLQGNWRHRLKDGSLIDVEIVRNMIDFNGRRAGLVLIRDVTQEKRAEERIRFQAHLLDEVGQAAVATRLDGTIIYWNNCAERLFGWTASEAIGRNVLEVTPALNSREQAEEIMLELRNGKSWSGEFPVRRRDGTVFPALVTDSPVRDDEGTLIGIIGVSTDLTERKKAEEQLREADRRAVAEYQALLQRVGSLAHAAGTARDLQSIFRALTGFVLESVPCCGIFASLYDMERNERTCVYAWCEGVEEDVSTLSPMPVSTTPHSRAISSAQIIVTDDLDSVVHTPRPIPLGEDRNPREPASSVCLPMIVLGQVIGAYEVQSAEHAAFTPEHVTALSMAANLAAIAVSNTRLLESLRDELTERLQAENALRASEEQYRRIVETAAEGIWVIDREGTTVFANGKMADLLNCSVGDLIGHPMADFVDEEFQASIAVGRVQGRTGITERQREVRLQCHGDRTIWVSIASSPMSQRDGSFSGALAMVTDITAQRASQDALRRLAAIVQSSNEAVIGKTLDGIITSWNRGAEALYGYSAHEIVGQSVNVLIPDDRKSELKYILDHIKGGHSIADFETVRVRRDGSLVDVAIAVSPIHDATGQVEGASLIARNISDRKLHEEELQHQALHDTLTGLANRTLFEDRLEQSIRDADRNVAPRAVLLLDLDRFKEVNDTLGHRAGDVLLQDVSRRFTKALRESDTVARLGGDEFAVLLTGSGAEGGAISAQKLLESLREPIMVGGHPFYLGVSIGIAVYPEHGNNVSDLLRHADVAMYSAKRSGAGFTLYQPEADPHSPQRLDLIASLREAIERDELILHYQPKVSVKTGCSEQVEALVRWIHPVHGFIPPDVFIPLAEHTGLIRPLTAWVLNQALEQQSQWVGSGFDINVAINLSAWNLQDSTLLQAMTSALQRWNVSPSSLTMEITESALMLDPGGSQAVLEDLHAMGIRISIDDFGTGYSSMRYLQRLPVDEIKIDRSFVMDMKRDSNAASIIVRSVIDLGHNLGLEVVAEGVEQQEHLDALAVMGCDLVQGYYLSRPIPATEYSIWLRLRDERTCA